MPDPVARASELIKAILCAAVVADPLNPGLTADEVRQVLFSQGVGTGAFDDAMRDLRDLPRDAKRRLLAKSSFWSAISWQGIVVPTELLPHAALDAVARVFDEIENEMGRGASVSIGVLRARGASVLSSEIDRAVGLLVSWDYLATNPDGFGRKSEWPTYDVPMEDEAFAKGTSARILAVLPQVQQMFAARPSSQVPGEPPVERFGRFLKKQGWAAFEAWWAMTANELRSLLDTRHTSATCVLAGALLEGALVAVAHPAQQAGEWRQKFLKDPPESWKLGALIDQAVTAGTLTDAQGAMAQEVAAMRNRIHAGRFSSAGNLPFSPPYRNTHEARLCRDHLDRLLAAILDWRPIRALNETNVVSNGTPHQARGVAG